MAIVTLLTRQKKAFFFVVNTRRQRGPRVATKSWQMLTEISVQTAMGNSSVGNIGNCESLVCDILRIICVLLFTVGGIVS